MRNIGTALFVLIIAFIVGIACIGHIATAAPAARTCATVNNVTNAAAWRDSTGRTHRARYTDNGSILFDRPVPRSVHIAAAKLDNGPIGPKIARACA